MSGVVFFCLESFDQLKKRAAVKQACLMIRTYEHLVSHYGLSL